jgi:hypothetical protein
MGVGGQRHAPAALTPGKTRYQLYRRLGGPQSRSGQLRKIPSAPPPPHRDLITGPSSPYRVAKPTELLKHSFKILYFSLAAPAFCRYFKR